jgi:hypothetical protein
MSRTNGNLGSTWYFISMGEEPAPDFFCPKCGREVSDPLICGDCLAVICRVCGTPLEKIEELGIG